MRGGPRSGGLRRWLVLHPVPRQEFAEAVLRDVGDAGEDVGKPGLGLISLSLAVVIRLNMKEALHASIDRADLVLSPVATRLDQAERWLAASGGGRKSGGEGRRVSVGVDLGGGGIHKKKK